MIVVDAAVDKVVDIVVDTLVYTVVYTLDIFFFFYKAITRFGFANIYLDLY